MRPSIRFLLAVLAATAISLVIVAVPILLRGGGEPAATPAPAPTPGLRVVAGDVVTAPQVPAAAERQARLAIEKALLGMYRSAFVRPAATPDPDSSPTPRPRPAALAGQSMTRGARAALRDSPEIFDEARDLSVYAGRVSYGGMISFQGEQGVEAFLNVDFAGDATPIGPMSPRVRIRQRGTVVMKRFDHGWFVHDFALRTAIRPVPTPAPSPAASPR